MIHETPQPTHLLLLRDVNQHLRRPGHKLEVLDGSLRRNPNTRIRAKRLLQCHVKGLDGIHVDILRCHDGVTTQDSGGWRIGCMFVFLCFVW